MRDRFMIAERPVGEGAPVYVIAEAGSNHDGDLARAHRLVEVAAEAGADAVKFQLFRADRLYPRSAGSSDYLGSSRPIHEIIAALEMPVGWLPELAGDAASRGLHFLVTPFDEVAADAIEPYVPAYKIASYEMTHHPLIAHVARKGKPLIVSTGAATLDEVLEMVEVVRGSGCEELVVNQCSASYPAPLNGLDVRALSTLRRATGALVGFSDHSREPLAGPAAAVALGACIIEKHFTLDNDLPGPDHAYAVEPDELRALVTTIRQVEACLGSAEKAPGPEEQDLRSFARRSVFTTRRIGSGERLGPDNIAVLRCGKKGYGLHPREYPALIGRRARRDLAAETLVDPADLE
jgi:N-acetylneuraminate synthase